MQNKLLPCPFCGGEAKLIKHFIVALDTEYRQVFCTSCCAKRPVEKFFTEEEAIKHWNTRKPMERIVERLEERHKFYENRFEEMSGTDRDVEDWGSIKSYADAIEIVKGGVDNG